MTYFFFCDRLQKRKQAIHSHANRSAKLKAKAARSFALCENRMWNKPDHSTVLLCAPIFAHRLVLVKAVGKCLRKMWLPWQRCLANFYKTQTKRFPIKLGKVTKFQPFHIKPFSSYGQKNHLEGELKTHTHKVLCQ